MTYQIGKKSWRSRHIETYLPGRMAIGDSLTDRLPEKARIHSMSWSHRRDSESNRLPFLWWHSVVRRSDDLSFSMDSQKIHGLVCFLYVRGIIGRKGQETALMLKVKVKASKTAIERAVQRSRAVMTE
jgi:hypothetical protein